MVCESEVLEVMAKETNGRRLKWVSVVLAVMMVFTIFVCVKQWFTLKALDQQLAEEQVRYEALEAENEALQEEKELLDDAVYMERLARERFNLIKPNEYLVVPAEENDELEEKGDVSEDEIH